MGIPTRRNLQFDRECEYHLPDYKQQNQLYIFSNIRIMQFPLESIKCAHIRIYVHSLFLSNMKCGYCRHPNATRSRTNHSTGWEHITAIDVTKRKQQCKKERIASDTVQRLLGKAHGKTSMWGPFKCVAFTLLSIQTHSPPPPPDAAAHFPRNIKSNRQRCIICYCLLMCQLRF